MDENHRLECGKMLQIESGQIIFLCEICSGEFISLGLFVRHHRMIHGGIQLQPLEQKITYEATRWQPLTQRVTHGAVKLQPLEQKMTYGSIPLRQKMTNGAVKLQPLQLKTTLETTRLQPSPQTVTHGAVKQQLKIRYEGYEATRWQPLTQTVTHGAVKFQQLEQKMTHGAMALQQKMTNRAVKLQPLQLNTTLETTQLQPPPQTVTHGAVKLQQKIRYGDIPLHRKVTQDAVKLQPLQQTIARTLTEKKYPLVVIRRSDPPATQTTSAKKSAPISLNSSGSDKTILSGKLLGHKLPQVGTKFREEFDISGRTEVHRDTCKPKVRIKCDYCSNTYLSTGGLRIHMHRHHKLNIPFLCDACPKAFNMPSELTMHQRTHGAEKNILCDFCDKQFLTKYQRGIHVKCDHPNETYRCTVCFFDSKVLGVVRRHQSLVHGI